MENNTAQFVTIEDTTAIVDIVVDNVRRAVVSTMGPNGKLALIGVGTSAKVTKDGVTVAKAIKFNDPRQELVNRVIVEPAIKTDMECGDGTTTTILLTSLLYDVFKQFPGYVEQRFIEAFLNNVIKRLTDMAIKIDVTDHRLMSLALTSSNDDYDLSELVTRIYADSNGKFPEVELKEGTENKDKVSRTSGLPIGMMFSNPGFSQFGNGTDTAYESFYPVVIDENVRAKDPEQFVTILKGLDIKCQEKNIPILIIARSIDHDYNSILAQASNSLGKGVKRFIGIQTNMGGSVGSLLMQDIASIFGVPMFSRIDDVLNMDITPVLGEELVVGNTRSLLMSQSEETKGRIEQRVQSIKQELDQYDMGERFSIRARFNEKRIRNLQGQLVTVFVGGETISEIKERVDRFEDVIKAVKSALINGILPGVGTSLIKAVYDEIAAHIFTGNPYTSTEATIANELFHVATFQYKLLMEGVITDDPANPIAEEWRPLEIVNLATGERGSPEEMGVFDTAYASITALKGGLQTAKILANTRSLLLGDKLSAIKLQQ